MYSKSDQQEAIERLREMLSPGDTVYTILRHVSRSGMTRIIDPVILGKDGAYHLGWLVSQALDEPYDRNREGVKVSGCGMDMGFALVYDLSGTIFPDGFDCIGKGCPANDHVNRVETTHHQAGGYALRHKWL